MGRAIVPMVIANSGWGGGGGAGGAVSYFVVAENDLKYQKILQSTVLQKRSKLHFQ